MDEVEVQDDNVYVMESTEKVSALHRDRVRVTKGSVTTTPYLRGSRVISGVEPVGGGDVPKRSSEK